METTETEVKTQEWGLGFSSPNPLDQPRRHDIRICVNDLLQSRAVSSAFHTFRVGTGIVWIQPKLVTQVLSRNARFVTRQ